jgi:hypothetical protein
VQIGTENQFILGYSLHQRPTDTRCLKPHLEKVKSTLGQLLGTLIADAGYGGPDCTKAAVNREVKVSLNYMRLRKQAREKLRSEEGYALSVRRMTEPESVFGQIKNNRGFS